MLGQFLLREIQFNLFGVLDSAHKLVDVLCQPVPAVALRLLNLFESAESVLWLSAILVLL